MSFIHLATSMIGLAERGRLPDPVVRAGIRSLLRKRLKLLENECLEKADDQLQQFVAAACTSPIACLPEKANEQHYEVPSDFFGTVLGPHRKYSCCYWDDSTRSLADAEANALARTCDHAQLADGQTILELGCGWGSLSLWMAEHYPKSQITAVSNSHSQREYIQQEANRRGCSNLTVITCDINDFQISQKFDRVVSVEMFEHVRNHQLLMKQISEWLNESGKLLVHIFCHRRHAYLFEDGGQSDWMARHFFSGGMMPSQDLLLRYQHHLALERRWTWDGTHYEKTSNAWLQQMDSNLPLVASVLKSAYGSDWKLWKERWRIFFMSCAELFAFRQGREWYVSHYLFCRTEASR